MVFDVILEGGPPLLDDENARLVSEAEPDAAIERTAADGTSARFRISGDYRLVHGRERRVYRFEP
jgi:hypothetical protein